MIIGSTPAAGTNAARRTAHLVVTAVLAALLAACGGGGGGGDPAGGGTFPTGAFVNAQGSSHVAPAALSSEAAAQVDPAGGGAQQLLAVGPTAAGGRAIAWLAQDAFGNASVQLRRWDMQGGVLGSDIVIGVDTLGGTPAATVLDDGGMVVASALSGPLSVDQPWITRSAIRVQRLDAHGRAGLDLDIGAVQQNRIGATSMRYVADPAVIRWDHGGFLVGWALVEEDASGRSPQFWVQRFDGAGRPVGTPSLAAPGAVDGGFRLAASPNGGWVLTTTHRVSGRTVLRHHPFEGAGAPALPAGAGGFAQDTVLLPLQGGGSVLFSPADLRGFWQRYGRDGRPEGASGGLPGVPRAATALPDGGFVVFTGAGAQLEAQRFDGAGLAVGGPAPVAGGADLQAAALADGSLMLGWTGARADGSPVAMMQRLR